MPIYEYLCKNCGKRFSHLIGVIAEASPPKCPRCGEENNLVKLLSRVVRLRQEEEILESVADESKWGDIDENDPRSIASFMRKLGKEMGEEDEEWEELVERMESEEELPSETEASGED